MNEDQVIYNEIGKALWSIMPHHASVIYCLGRVYPETHQVGPEWIDKQGKVNRFNVDEYPVDICDKISHLAISLQKLPPYKREPWTHFKFTLFPKGKFKMEFSYIPQDDSWPGVFMRRVSDLTLEEAKNYYIPENEWNKCIEKYKEK
ncbi:immunity protein YezG family protein [Photobacterium halotolerans]|uniref:immunity protein YezG family protein n=1 Tax=Photobacterium halotolerans TaxID=265726 RepID=UPI0005679D5D|nr:immunity protein YezG family protein [Photobacterium halotolerans]